MSATIGIILSFSAALCWGTGFVIYKQGVKKTNALSATFLRGIVAIPLFFIIAIVIYGSNGIISLFKGQALIWLLLSVITITFGDFFSLFSMRKIDASISQPISAIYPVITNLVLLSFAIEKVTITIIIGTLLNVTGATIISLFSNKRTETESSSNNDYSNDKEKEAEKDKREDKKQQINNKKKINAQGIIFALSAALFWGVTIVFTKILISIDSVYVIPMLAVRNGLMVLIAGVILLGKKALSSITNTPMGKITNKKDLIFLIIGGIVTWLGGGGSFFTAVNLIGAARSTPISSISPFVVLIWSAIFLKEKIVKFQVLGVTFIVVGSILLSL